MVNKLTTYLSIGNCYLFYYRKCRQEVGADLTMPPSVSSLLHVMSHLMPCRSPFQI